MTSVLSWNIQNGKGCDGKISLERIAAVIGAMGTPDIICLQEVSRGLVLEEGSAAPDQVAELQQLFPDYEIAFGVAFEARTPGKSERWQYGNAILTKMPLLMMLAHPLPRPGVENIRHMTRQATEVVVEDDSGPLRIVNTHLEFHSAIHRMAQVDRLRDLQREAIEETTMPPLTSASGPYQQVARPVDAIYCGDFNMAPGSEEYRRLLAPLAGEAEPFIDAWLQLYPDREHDPTCGIHDHEQWPEGPHCRDFFFAAGRCTACLRALRVDAKTDASDHQPLMLELGGLSI
ncbi:MAG TPA: endonuclease/exonuclease/phosphatase family protein [Gammaproteobacteria bacterium]|jgi:endonuclease/exonuclease/phosphatase family metal-dependent hydrolase